MSVDISVCKLKWDAFLDVHESADSTESVLLGLDEVPPYMEYFENFCASHNAAQEAAEWVEEGSEPMEALASLFSDESEEEPFVGIVPKGELLHVYRIYSPEHVKALATKIGKIDWAEFRSLVDGGDCLDPFDGPQELVDYMKKWAAMVDEASENGLALCLSVG